MPMKLRDGKVYASRKSSRMLLRDGKLVDGNQSVSLNSSGVLADYDSIWGNGVQRGLDQRLSPKKLRQADGSEAASTIPAIAAPPGLKKEQKEADGTQRQIALRPRRKMEERTTQVIQKTVQKTLVRSAEKSKRYRSQSPGFDEVGLNTRVHKQVDSVPRQGKLSGDSGFVTSTPLLSGSPQSRESNAEVSFTFSEAYKEEVYAKEVERSNVNEESFTRLRSKETKVKNHSSIPAEKSSPSTSFTKKNNSSIEENIFEDLSKSILYSNISDDAAETREDETDFSLPKGRSLSCPSVSTTSDISLNHARWGRFHNWRRQWYLNRWHTDTEHFTVKRWWFSRLFSRIVYILMVIQTAITTRLLLLKNFIKPASLKNTGKVELHRRARSNLTMHRASSKRHKPKKKPKDFCFLIGVPVILSILAGMLIAYGFLSPFGEEYLSGPAFNLTELGLTNTKYVSLGKSRNIFAWHVLPEGAMSDAVKLAVGFPVAFYIRNADSNDAKRKIEMFKILSSAGYNIIIPVFPAAKLNLIEGWKWTHKSFKGSAVYLWGEVGAASDMSELAKDLCREGFPPHGVIIETELIDETLPTKELEVWTCNCTTVMNDNGSPFTYTHVKCPVSEDNTQKDIIDCLQHLKQK